MAHRPPTWRLAAGIGLILAGVITGATLIILGVTGAFASLLRFPAPGAGDVHLDPGSYTVFWETPGMFVREGTKGADVDFRVVSKAGGRPVGVNTGGLWTSHYSTLDGRVGVSIADFFIDAAGDYTVTAKASKGKALGSGGIALTRDLGFLGLVRIIAVPLLILFAGVGAGVFILVKSPKPSAATPVV